MRLPLEAQVAVWALIALLAAQLLTYTWWQVFGSVGLVLLTIGLVGDNAP